MSVTTTFPGIYNIEDAQPNFSIRTSATAVPVFAYNKGTNDGAPDTDVNVFYSWNEFKAIVDEQSDYINADYFKSLYAWFMGGGGKCYLVLTTKIVEAVGQNDDITLLVAAGTEMAIVAAINQLTSQGYPVFGLLDGPVAKIALTSTNTPDKVMADYPASAYAAVFYPQCHTDTVSGIPASVIAAISIAQTDRTRGVWKAPANVPINGFTPDYPVSDDLQGQFNQGKALNMIRTFPETGTVVWGTRTLEDSDNWRYIPVRRLFNMIERDIKNALNQVVFEPNNQPTWQRVKAAVESYLYSLWRQGGLMGETPQEAWFIRIGLGVTMTQEDINQRKLILQIGVAAVHPAEFIILRFSQNIAQ